MSDFKTHIITLKQLHVADVEIEELEDIREYAQAEYPGGMPVEELRYHIEYMLEEPDGAFWLGEDRIKRLQKRNSRYGLAWAIFLNVLETGEYDEVYFR
jgi:hypothetical protein